MLEHAKKLKEIERKILDMGNITVKTSGTSSGERRDFSIDLSYRFESSPSVNFSKDVVVGFMYSLDSWAAISVVSFCVKNKIEYLHLQTPEDLRENGNITHMCLTPSQISIFNADSFVYENIKQITLGGEYCRSSVLRDAKAIFPNSRITQIYSTTETGFICSTSDEIEGFPKEKFKNVDVLSDRIIVNGIEVFDIWRLKGERYCYYGRSDAKVNVGGTLVSPDFVERKILSVHGVLDCNVFSKPAPIIGNILCAEYVGSIDKLNLKAEIKKKLGKAEMPVLFKVDKINVNENGKREKRRL